MVMVFIRTKPCLGPTSHCKCHSHQSSWEGAKVYKLCLTVRHSVLQTLWALPAALHGSCCLAFWFPLSSRERRGMLYKLCFSSFLQCPGQCLEHKRSQMICFRMEVEPTLHKIPKSRFGDIS